MSKLAEMSRDEEREFWGTHSSADYWNEMESVELVRGPRPKNRCATCGNIMVSRYVDVELAGGRVVLRGVRQLHCREEHETHLAPEAQRVVDAIEAVLRLAPNVVGVGQRFAMVKTKPSGVQICHSS